MNQPIKAYLKEVTANLDCPRSVRSVFRSELRSDIEDFAKDKPDLTVETLCEQFGSPDALSAEFIARSDYGELLQKAKKKAKKWRILCIVAAVLLVLAISMIVYFYYVIDEYAGTIHVSNPITSTDIAAKGGTS